MLVSVRTCSNTLTYLHPHLPSALLWKGQGNQNDFVSEAVQLSLQSHLDFVSATLSTTNWKILQEMGIPDHHICLLRNLYAR